MGTAAVVLKKAPAAENTAFTVDGHKVETPFYLVEFNEAGQISRLYDKENDREVLAPGQCGNVLQVFEDNGVSIEHMPSGIDTMSIFVNKDVFEEKEQKILADIHKAVNPDHIELESNLALIAVVGRGMKSTRGTAGRIFSALAHAHINVKMIDQGSSELNIIIGVRHDDFKNAIRALYEIFVLTQI